MLNKNESTLNAYFAVMVSINLTLAHYAEETRENSLFKQADANLKIIPFLLLGGKRAQNRNKFRNFLQENISAYENTASFNRNFM